MKRAEFFNYNFVKRQIQNGFNVFGLTLIVSEGLLLVLFLVTTHRHIGVRSRGNCHLPVGCLAAMRYEYHPYCVYDLSHLFFHAAILSNFIEGVSLFIMWGG